MSTSVTRYNRVAILLHWVIAVLMILMLGVGLVMEDFPDAWMPTVMTLHKSTGITILGLSVFRLIWRLMNPVPPLPEGMKPHERMLAHGAHVALYFLIIAIPLSGWIFTSAAAKYPLVYFWLVEIPFLPMPAGADPKAIKEFFEEAHELFANGAMLLIALHIAAAIYHHRILKDNVLTRMLPRRNVR